MYLQPTDKITVELANAVTTLELSCVASYQDITSAGMTLPQLSNQTLTTGTTPINLVVAPSASTTRQVVHINIFNADSSPRTVTVSLDVSGTPYVLITAFLQPDDTLQWSRESGWAILTQTVQSSVLFTVFDADGTYTKPSGLKRVMLAVIGAGGGGGSGRRGAAASNRFGGGGGGGGAFVLLSLTADAISPTTAVTIGVGGVGGAGQTADGNNGSAGTAGGDSSFGGIAIARGGNFGGGGSTAAGAIGSGGPTASCNPNYGPFSLTGANGAAGNTITTSAGATGFIGTTGAAGGGGGGGINSANTSGVAAMTGGAVYQNGILQTGPVSGASPNGVDNKSVFLHMSTTLTSGYGLGTGGAGGVPATPNGGNGGLYGAGGGGGSGVLDGTTSGAGGNGADGLVVIMEIY